MGLIRGSVTLANPTRPELVPLPVSALADSGAVHLCIPEHLAIQLELTELERREVGPGRRPPPHGALCGSGGGALRQPPLLHRRHGAGHRGAARRHPNGGHGSGAEAPAAEPGGEPRKPEPADERGDAGGRRKASASN